MDPPSTGSNGSVPSQQQPEAGNLRGRQSKGVSKFTHKYKMQCFSQLPECCPQITITYSEQITQNFYIL